MAMLQQGFLVVVLAVLEFAAPVVDDPPITLVK